MKVIKGRKTDLISLVTVNSEGKYFDRYNDRQLTSKSRQLTSKRFQKCFQFTTHFSDFRDKTVS